MEMGLPGKSPGPRNFTVSHLRAEGSKTQGSKEPSLAGLCNSLSTYPNCSVLPKFSSGNEGFPVPLAKYPVLVSDNVLSIKPSEGGIWLSQVSE